MNNEPPQEKHAGTPLPRPTHLNPKQIELSKKLDDFYRKNNFKPLRPKPSDIFIGAIYGMQEQHRSNPDWIAQVANSLRELLYPIWYEVRGKKNKPVKITNKFRRLGYAFIDDVFSEIEEVYGKLNDLAHHGLDPQNFMETELNSFSESDFRKLANRFENSMFKAFTLPLPTIMERIDQLLSKTPATHEDQDALEGDVKSLIREASAKKYFYYKADERWQDWLWQNGFLNVIKEKTEDPTRYGDALPELDYLVQMSEKAPAKVVDMMLAVPISPETFNPVVVDRFLAICSNLPADQLARMVKKIRDEHWIPLRSAFRLLGYEYKKMFKRLADSKNYQSLLVLAEAVLAVRTQEEIEKAPSRYRSTPFYFDDLSSTDVFEHLSHVGTEYREKAFDLTTKVMAEAIASEWRKSSDQGQLQQLAEQEIGHDEGESEEVFKVDDISLLLNVDFFDLESGEADRFSPKNDVRELAVVIRVFAEKLIGDHCDKPETIRGIYEKYIGDFDNPDAKLPDSQAMWRLRLFVLSLCPAACKDKLKKALYRLFESEQYYEIIRGTEYKKALQKGFAALSEEDRCHYVKWVVEYFTQQDREKGSEEENWHIRNGSHILSMIANQLTEAEKTHAEEAGLSLDLDYPAEPAIGTPRVGTVVPRGPTTEETFGKLSLNEIAEKLRNEWKPNELTKQNTMDDSLNPLNADGVGQSLKNDMPNRLQEYVRNAAIFFERGVLDEHYTYSFLRGIQETIHAHGETASNVNWDGVIALCMAIKVSGEQAPFEEERRERGWFDTFRAGWGAVHFAMTEVLQALLSEKTGLLPLDFGAYRDRIFSIISYLLSHPDPFPEDEQIDTAKSKTTSSGDAGYQVSDPLHMAVNSVRGQAFKTFAFFMDQDGRKFKKEDAVKIAEDVKELYESALEKETTRAIRFMFGHYLPFFYFRDRDWIGGLLPQIFPQEPAKKHLYTAAWEGYLANNLYEAMFFDPEIQKLYERGLALTDADYPPQQERFKKPDEGVAEHLALAFMHYNKFGFDHPLFDAFRGKNNPELYANFVNFIGRFFVSGNNANGRELLKKETECMERLKVFWDWLLKHSENPKPFIQFDSWINLENGFFEPAWLAERVRKTLKKTQGALDSDHELTKSIVRLAQANPEDALEISQLYLLEGGIRRGEHRELLLYTDDWVQWKEALNILHENQETKARTFALIDELMRDGGGAFWDLTNILDT